MSFPVVMCIEASHVKGLGHLYRSLRVADMLRAVGMACCFVVNDDPPAVALLLASGYAVRTAPVGTADGCWERSVLEAERPRVWWNDRLDTGAAHAQIVLESEAKLITVDDAGAGGQLANALVLTMPCRFAVPGPTAGQRYSGADYMLLDPALRGHALQRGLGTGMLRLLVSMGGSDTWGATVTIVRQLAQGLPAAVGQATVITGASFTHEAQLEPFLRQAPYLKHKKCVPDLFAEFDVHDLLLCAGGMTAFEAAAAGLPACVVATEPHEEANAAFLQEQGCALLIGRRDGERLVADVEAGIGRAATSLSDMSLKGMALCDVKGVERCANLVQEMYHG